MQTTTIYIYIYVRNNFITLWWPEQEMCMKLKMLITHTDTYSC